MASTSSTANTGMFDYLDDLARKIVNKSDSEANEILKDVSNPGSLRYIRSRAKYFAKTSQFEGGIVSIRGGEEKEESSEWFGCGDCGDVFATTEEFEDHVKIHDAVSPSPSSSSIPTLSSTLIIMPSLIQCSSSHMNTRETDYVKYGRIVIGKRKHSQFHCRRGKCNSSFDSDDELLNHYLLDHNK